MSGTSERRWMEPCACNCAPAGERPDLDTLERREPLPPNAHSGHSCWPVHERHRAGVTGFGVILGPCSRAESPPRHFSIVQRCCGPAGARRLTSGSMRADRAGFEVLLFRCQSRASCPPGGETLRAPVFAVKNRQDRDLAALCAICHFSVDPAPRPKSGHVGTDNAAHDVGHACREDS
jgi:hypothetical protein